jgi:hypothetical protein
VVDLQPFFICRLFFHFFFFFFGIMAYVAGKRGFACTCHIFISLTWTIYTIIDTFYVKGWMEILIGTYLSLITTLDFNCQN